MSKMVQVFMVLRCYSCETFQVHQVKKSSNKWLCKICNEKQSVQKVYGQGTAGDCRKHVQKLNMLRGEQEALEQHLLNHPPEDYAATFDEDTRHGDDTTPEHPVLLTEKVSRWKMYTEPQDSTSEEEMEGASGCGLYTTNKGDFEQARKKKRSNSRRRHDSDSSNPCPHSKTARGGSLTYKHRTVSHSHAPVHPYSSVSSEMDLKLSGRKSSGSYIHSSSERYQKLDDESTVDSTFIPTQKMVYSRHEQNLGSYKSTNKSPAVEPQHLGMSQEQRMASIRNDIGRFSRNSATTECSVVPATSSRWSKFMNEVEDDDDVEGEGEGRDLEGVHMHLLQSKVTVAKYN